MKIDIRPVYLESPTATTLIQQLNAELSDLYPDEEMRHFRLDPGEVAPGHGAFLVAYADDVPVGCGALRKLEDERAEIKRMYVYPSHRRLGVGRALLRALEESARAMQVKSLVLETGERQPEAIALYTDAGFSQIPLFGEYEGSPLSICMGKDLC